MTDEEKEFVLGCDKFKGYANIEEYIDDVQNCLVLSSWHYTQEDAQKCISQNMDLVKRAFEGQEPANDIAMDIGYCCG